LDIVQQGGAQSIEELLKETLLEPMKELKRYAFYSFMMEILCLVNVIAQFFFMDRFMGGEFLSFGPRGNCLHF
jgi:innexin